MKKNFTLERFNEISNYDINKANLLESAPIENDDCKYAGTELFESVSKRLNSLMEFTSPQSYGIYEADDDNQDAGPDAGGAPDMGGDAPMGPDAGGASDMGGGAPMGPDAGGAPDMGGDAPMGPDAGGAPDMGGAPDGGQGGANGPEGFNPQVDDSQGMGDDMGEMSPMGDDMEGGMPTDQQQPDDEVVDITELTDTQDETEKKVEKLGDKFDKVFKAIGQFEELLRSNDEKIEKLKTEFEKRNPTQIEKLGLQTTNSYPFNVTPTDFWKEKEATSNYSTEPDDNGKEQGQYAITAKDIKGDVDWRGIADSLDDKDFIYNQTLNGVLKI